MEHTPSITSPPQENGTRRTAPNFAIAFRQSAKAGPVKVGNSRDRISRPGKAGTPRVAVKNFNPANDLAAIVAEG